MFFFVVTGLINKIQKVTLFVSHMYGYLTYLRLNVGRYGYLTNTKVKFILVTTDLDVRDADVRNFFRRFHSAYLDAVSNPFHVPGKKITSKTFAERVTNIVKSVSFHTTG
ncbi:putative trafficking protein particle complex subunit 2 [Helianthus annuus]|nr:putative trafficking protein particle complex subunit 2 [Helianthus annuus]KAJ0774667.1 putative trafficking protein particle complex subunit 2 [Helianthus annuus]